MRDEVARNRSTMDGPSDEPKGRGLRRSLIYFGTVATSQGIAFLLLPFVSRTLDPEAYGAYALALTISTLVGMVASSWVRNVALRLYFDALTRRMTRGFFLGTALIQVIFFLALYTVTLLVYVASGFELVSLRVMLSAGATVIVSDLAIHSFTLLRAEQRTGEFAVAEIGSGLLRFGLTLAGLAAGFRSAEVLFDATTAGFLLGAVYALPRLWRRLQGPARIDRQGTTEVIRHGPAALPFSVADWIEQLADRLVLGHVLGTAAVGVYSVGYTIGERTIGILVRAVFMMAWPNILSSYSSGGAAEARGAITQAQILYAWFTCGPTVFMVAFGPDALRLVTGPAYHEAAQIVGIVAASMWIGGYTSYLNRHLELQKRFGELSGIRLAGASLNIGLNLWLIPLFGMYGAAWATIANRTFNAIVFFLRRDRTLVHIPIRVVVTAFGWSAMAYVVSAAMPSALLGMTVFVALYVPAAIMAMRRIG